MSARTALDYAVGIVGTVALAGCVRFPSAATLLPRPAAQMRASGDFGDSSDLRIPANAVARAGQEIPVVPVPPIPQGRDLERRYQCV